MLLGATICMFCACILLCIGFCFARGKIWSFILQILSLVALICFGITLATYKNSFDTYTILLLASVVPQLLNLFNPNSINIRPTKTPSTTTENEEIDVDNQNIEDNTDFLENAEMESATLENNETTLVNLENTETVEADSIVEDKQNVACPKMTKVNFVFIGSICTFLTAVILAFCGFYWGLEVAYGFILGALLAGGVVFLLLALKKNFKLFDLLSLVLSLISAGIMLGQSILVLMYSLEFVNWLYVLGALSFATFAILNPIKNNRYNHLLLAFSLICMVATMIF